MSTEVRVPSTGNSAEPAVVLDVLVSVGQTVAAGDPIAQLETAKATVDVEAPVGGTVLRLDASAGDEAAEHSVLAVLGAEGESAGLPLPEPVGGSTSPAEQISSLPTDTAATSPARRVGTGGVDPGSGGEADIPGRELPSLPTGTAVTPLARRAGTGGVGPSSGSEVARPAVNARGRIKASPRARILAERRGIDLATLTGSGPAGRIIVSDVLAARDAAAAPAEPVAPPEPAEPSAPSNEPEDVEVVPVRGSRKITAERMHDSLRSSAQVTLTRYAGADRLLALAARFKEGAVELDRPRIGVNDLLLFAAARTAARHPEANAHFSWDGIRRYRHVGLGFAVDTPGALLVPVIDHAEQLSLAEIARSAHTAIERAGSGRLSLAEMEGGTFTVTNLGGLGVHWFTPVLNPPQACILGVGAAQGDPGSPGRQLPLSLTFDHRALDGAAAAAFLADIVIALENIDILTAY